MQPRRTWLQRQPQGHRSLLTYPVLAENVGWNWRCNGARFGPSKLANRNHPPSKECPHEDDHRRSFRESAADAWHRACLRHHRFGLHADFRPVPQGRNHLLGLRPRGLGRHDGRRLHPGFGQDEHDDRPERPGHHQFRDACQNRLLEPHAAAAGDAAGRQPHHRHGRIPGSGADGALQGHGVLPGRSARPQSRGGSPQPRDHERQAALRARSDQHAARLLDSGDRHRASGDRRF